MVQAIPIETRAGRSTRTVPLVSPWFKVCSWFVLIPDTGGFEGPFRFDVQKQYCPKRRIFFERNCLFNPDYLKETFFSAGLFWLYMTADLSPCIVSQKMVECVWRNLSERG